MAKARVPKEYISQAVPSMIRATSRVSVKINESFYTFEFSEERVFPIDLVEDGKINFEKEKEMLWDSAHAEVDKQVSDVLSMLKEKRGH